MYVWLIENGQKIKSFHDLHESSELITMEFDETNTRIYTASSDGSIKVKQNYSKFGHFILIPKISFKDLGF
jgi:hypothetical protein